METDMTTTPQAELPALPPMPPAEYLGYDNDEGKIYAVWPREVEAYGLACYEAGRAAIAAPELLEALEALAASRQSRAVQGPDGHLHDDGYFTWAPGKRPPDRSDHAGWRADFYLVAPSAPQALAERVTGAAIREPLTDAQVNHLRRLIGWASCEVGQSPDEMVQGVRALAAQGLETDEEGRARLLQAHHAASNVPKYVRSAIKALREIIRKIDDGKLPEAR